MSIEKLIEVAKEIDALLAADERNPDVGKNVININMSHTRFQSTLAALRECSDALDASDTQNPLDNLSEEEREAANELIKLCSNIWYWYGEEYFYE